MTIHQASPQIRSVLIVDEHESFRASLGSSFRQLGLDVWIESDLADAKNLTGSVLPGLLIFELTVGGRSTLDAVADFRRVNPRCLIAIATLSPSIDTAIRATRLGIDAYVTKPVSASLILSMFDRQSVDLGFEPPTEAEWPSLDRAIWEYLNQVFVTAGSMSEAARRLRLDRRSLRRMLDRNPPVG